MTYPAFEARDLTGAALLKEAALMADWKAASQRGDVLAVTVQGRNYVVVRDAVLVEAIKRIAPQLRVYRYHPVTATVSEPS